MVAALYVAKGGCYFGLPGVDPWDEERDARRYAGPWPVVAHPPCKTWSIMAQCRPEIRRGEDGGCFRAALASVRCFGGVLEHPANTAAWRAFGLLRPPSLGWLPDMFSVWPAGVGWVAAIDQRHYGHRARKPTWLYYVGASPPSVTWGKAARGPVSVRNDGGGGRDQRSSTPIPFRDLLLSMAIASGEPPARPPDAAPQVLGKEGEPAQPAGKGEK